ncbi:hybrid sensor histidine kinase/response regulator [Butyrivibrio sp. AE3004]|uniref:hybrid sensor histidine kinase/response regulator n=1 Tax=Butyrivibrio sp. AE3004 TaxID=1506994 RepID=UPI00068E9666|nr:ATP-binding protein [Butyrivibrio sp. AE3004]
MRSEKITKWVVPVVTALLFAVLIFVVNIIQNRYVYSDRIVQLTTYYSQLESAVTTRFTRYYKLLKSWSYHLEHEKSSGISDFLIYINTEKKIWEVEQVYLFDEKGNYRDSDGKIGTLKESAGFISNLSSVGTRQVTHIIASKGKHQDLFVLSIKPVKFNNKEFCAIGVAIDTDLIKSKLSIKRSDMAGSQNYIVNEDGDLIATSVSLEEEKENIVRYISQNGRVIYDPVGGPIEQKIETRKTGVCVMEIEGEDYYVTYMPVDYGKTMLVCLTPSKPIERSISQVRWINNILLISAFAVALAILMLLMRFISMQDMLKVANTANETKTRFLANMSHDFRTPMNAMSGYLALMKENADNPEKVIEYGEKAEYAHRNMLNMINCILDLSKMEAGGDEIKYERFSLNDVLRIVENEMGALAEGKKQNFTIDRSSVKEDLLIGDAFKLEIILKNLLQNSITYTDEEGEIRLDVFKEYEEDKERIHLKFEVSDNGIGMSKEFIEHAFEAFKKEQRKNANKEQGTGLGLTLTKTVVETLGGTIEAESKINAGTIFTVRLAFDIPKKTELEEMREIEEALENKENNDVQEEESAFKGMRFLGAEDNELNAEILVEILKMKGAGLIDIAEDGEKAVQMFKDKGVWYYDMILMDIQMPNMNGYEAAQEIRKLSAKGREDAGTIPIIAMSANAFKEDIEQTSESGMDAHIPKPIDIKLFENTVRAFKGRGHESI